MRVICLAYQLIGHMGLSYFLEQPDDEVVAVFTHEDAPGEQIWWPSVLELSREHGVPTYTPDDINSPDTVALLRSLRPDFIFSFWYRMLARQPVLDIPPGGCLNMHGSLLPLYRGRAPVNWVLVNGETETGITLHYMLRGADAGDIVAQAAVPIGPNDTPAELYATLAASGRELLSVTWPLLRAGEAPRWPQDRCQATYVGRRTPEDGCFLWAWPASRIHNLVRAVTHPYPGAFTACGERRLFLWATRLLPGRLVPCPHPPGAVVAVEDGGIRVATGRGHLLVTSLQLEGEEELDGASFARRHALTPGASQL